MLHSQKAKQPLDGTEQGASEKTGAVGPDDRCWAACAATDGRTQFPHRQGCGSRTKGGTGMDEVQVLPATLSAHARLFQLLPPLMLAIVFK